MKLCSATHSALLPEVTSFIVVNKREHVFAPQQLQNRLTSSHKIKLYTKPGCIKRLLGQGSLFSSWQWCPWAHNTWPMLVIFSTVCSKVFQNRFLHTTSAPSPTGTLGILNIMSQRLSPLNYYHRQGIFFINISRF